MVYKTKSPTVTSFCPYLPFCVLLCIQTTEFDECNRNSIVQRSMNQWVSVYIITWADRTTCYMERKKALQWDSSVLGVFGKQAKCRIK